MSSNTEEPMSDSEAALVNNGIKRDADSLFVEDEEIADAEEHFEDAVDRSPKRIKPSQNFEIEPLFSALHIGEDGRVVPYNTARTEGRPRLAIYHPSFKAAERAVSEICQDFLTVVQQVKEQYKCEFAEIDQICKDSLQPLLTPQADYPKVGPVALLGQSGIGKSSLIGSVVDNGTVAPESDGTKRGTGVVQELAGALKSQRALYQVAARYHSGRQIRLTVQTHCKNIFRYVRPSDELDEGEIDDLRTPYETGIEFFHTVLCNHNEFESYEATESYFEERNEDKLEEMVDTLASLIETFKDSRALVDNVEYHLAETNGELSDILKRTSKAPTTRSRNPHPWPLLVRSRTHLDNDLLNAGVMLADCPGITDTDQSVVDATMNYLQFTAGTICIVEKIERIMDSGSLDTNIRACLRLGKRSNICLIVTMIDHKQPTQPDERDELSPNDRSMLIQAEDILKKLETRKAELRQAKARASGYEYQEIDREYEDVPTKIAMAEALVNQINIEIRNRNVKERLQNKIRKIERQTNAPDLPVFFVSNTQYRQNIKGYYPEKPPCLDIEGTGIPALRKMLFSIPARGKKNTLYRICCAALPVHFNGIIGILTKSAMTRKYEVQRLIENVLCRRTALLKGLENKLKALFDDHITAQFDTHQRNWSEKASKLVGSWARFKAQNFLAFCRRGGRWRIRQGEPYIHWNHKIQNIFDGCLVDAFNALNLDIEMTGANTHTNIESLFSDLVAGLEECKDFQGQADTEPFFRVIRCTGDDLNKQVEKLFTNFATKVDVVRTMTLLDDEGKTVNAYVGKAMMKTYHDCIDMDANEIKAANGVGSGRRASKKSGNHAKRVDAIRNKVMGTDQEQSVFADASEQARDAFHEEVAALKKGCQEVLDNAHTTILNDFNRRFAVDDKEVKTEQDDKAAEKVKAAAKQALGRIEGELRQYVDEFEAYERSGSESR